MRIGLRRGAVLGVLAALANVAMISEAAVHPTNLVSLTADAAAGDRDSCCPAISATGRYIAFASNATNLVPGDANGQSDIFVRDLQAGTTERVSIDSAGNQGNRGSNAASISGDGRFVAFSSEASNLVIADTFGQRDIFVHDRQAGTTHRVSVSSAGGQARSWSDTPAISADGRYVAFISMAFNLVSGDTNWATDVFVHDIQTGLTERTGISSGGVQGNSSSDTPAISADGRFVAFSSNASNLVANDTNGRPDIFVRDRLNGTTTRESVGNSGQQGNGGSASPAISADGRLLAFSSEASNLVSSDTNGQPDVFIRDRQTGAIEIASVTSTGAQPNGWTDFPALSADGRFVVFESTADNIVADDTNAVGDIFIRDRQAGTTERSSVDSSGGQGNSWSTHPAISADARVLAFATLASNLAPNDKNGARDVFTQSRQGVIPTVEAGPAMTITEGATFISAGYFIDPDPDVWSGTVDYGEGAGTQSLALSGKSFALSHTYVDDGVFTVTVRVADPDGAGADTARVTVQNVPPVVGAIIMSNDVIGVDTEVTASAHFSDAGVRDIHSATVNWGDGATTAGTVMETGGSGNVFGSHAYAAAGIYTITLSVIDDDGAVAASTYHYLVVYDPNGPFVTGAGWADSAAGNYAAEPSIDGKINFSFVAQYKQDANTPDGVAEIKLPSGSKFHSRSYDWLVVTPSRIELRGTGTLDGAGNYEFTLAASYGGRGSDPDKIWIKLRPKDSAILVYDSTRGQNDLATPSSPICGGHIAVHHTAK